MDGCWGERLWTIWDLKRKEKKEPIFEAREQKHTASSFNPNGHQQHFGNKIRFYQRELLCSWLITLHRLSAICWLHQAQRKTEDGGAIAVDLQIHAAAVRLISSTVICYSTHNWAGCGALWVHRGGARSREERRKGGVHISNSTELSIGTSQRAHLDSCGVWLFAAITRHRLEKNNNKG